MFIMQLLQVMEKHEIEVKELKSRFIESREQNEMVSVDYAHAHHSVSYTLLFSNSLTAFLYFE